MLEGGRPTIPPNRDPQANSWVGIKPSGNVCSLSGFGPKWPSGAKQHKWVCLNSPPLMALFAPSLKPAPAIQDGKFTSYLHPWSVSCGWFITQYHWCLSECRKKAKSKQSITSHPIFGLSWQTEAKCKCSPVTFRCVPAPTHLNWIP